MNSRIYTGHVYHARLEPLRHVFRYPFYFYAFDLDELPQLDRSISFFGYNRVRPVAVHDRDYLRNEDGSIKEKLFRLLDEFQCADGIDKVWLVTAARFFNYVFNPVSFYYCLRKDGSLRCSVAEINNTFGERHTYVLPDRRDEAGDDYPAAFRHEKEFHVSPFNDMRGEYRFSLSDIGPSVDIRVDMFKEGRCVFKSQLKGAARPLDSRNLLRTVIEYPLTMALTMPRISWEAAKMYYAKKLPVFSKPIPHHEMTFRTAAPSLKERFAMRHIFKFLSRTQTGRLRLTLPDRSEMAFGDAKADEKSLVHVRDYNFFWRCLKDGDIGFAESYIAGEWDCDDLTRALTFFIDNRETLNGNNVPFSRLGRWINALRHRRNANTLRGSRRNIGAHYDLSNDMFKRFLDPSMTYSAAVFESPDQPLEEAQRNKLRGIIQSLNIQKNDHVLEIGSGWGSFAIQAARDTGCRVTTITISREQYNETVKRVREAGLEDRITPMLCDYRHLDGTFDKIVSIEMLEAVGHENYGTYFSALERMLAPGGQVFLQVISIPDERFETYRKRCDFIQKHIFPGGLLPSLAILRNSIAANSSLIIDEIKDIAPDYARTLSLWRKKFTSHFSEIAQLGFDEEFRRKWEYYFAYCEAGFANGALHTLQMVLKSDALPLA